MVGVTSRLATSASHVYFQRTSHVTVNRHRGLREGRNETGIDARERNRSSQPKTINGFRWRFEEAANTSRVI